MHCLACICISYTIYSIIYVPDVVRSHLDPSRVHLGIHNLNTIIHLCHTVWHCSLQRTFHTLEGKTPKNTAKLSSVWGLLGTTVWSFVVVTTKHKQGMWLVDASALELFRDIYPAI